MPRNKSDTKRPIEHYDHTDKCTVLQPRPEYFFGFQTIGDLFASIDILVSPHMETILNMSILEALQCGVPVISARGGPTEEYMKKGAIFLENTDTFIAPPDNTKYTVFNAEEIADKIMISCLNNLNKIRKKKSVIDRYSISDIKKKWIDILQINQ